MVFEVSAYIAAQFSRAVLRISVLSLEEADMSLNRVSVCARLCLLLVIWADHGSQGRSWPPNDQQGMPQGSVSINTGPAEGGTVNIVVYPWLGKWDYWRNRSVEIEDTPPQTTPKPTDQGTATTTTTATNHHMKTTRPHSTTTVGYNPSNIIIAPPIPRECPDGEKPDMSNNCRVEWGDFSRRIPGKSQLPVRSTPAPQSTARTSTVAHPSYTRKHRQ